MKKSFYVYRNLIRICSTLLCFVLLLGTLCLSAFADTKQQYKVTLDHPSSVSAENMPVVLKNFNQGTDPTLTLAGWIKSNFDMAYYEYTIDGGKSWIRLDDVIISRPDVKSMCPKTYETAGYHIRIDVSGFLRGVYDLFLRGYTKDGDVIDVLALIDVSIGETDTQKLAYTEINLNAFGAQDGKLTLNANHKLDLGAYNLRNYRYAEFILDQSTVLTLSSTSDSAISFSATTDTPVQNEDGNFTATIDLNNVQYAGNLILTAQEQVGITQIRLFTNVPDYYTGELTVHMTATPYEYLSGANNVDACLMIDDTVGTYTHLFPTTDTNDPYIYFNLGKYLEQTRNKQISADHYRYAVVTLQTPPTNSSGHFRLFLCAGDIRGPHGESHVSFIATNDGQWHTYVVPLCEEEYWNGTIYGMRFDFIDAHAKTSDYANIASIGLYPDEQSARAAADAPLTVYHEQGKLPEDQYKEEGRAPSGRADAITWFDSTLSDCFGDENKAKYSFDDYGHLILQATETSNDPYVSFNMQTYAALTQQPLLRTEDYGIVVLRILADKNITGTNFVLYYYAGGYDYAQGTRAVGASFEGDEWEYLVYDMSKAEYWTDDILGFRLDFASQIGAGQLVCLSDMLFFKDMAAWKAYAAENNVQHGDTPVTEAPTQEIETEIPTIEIPTQGPGLEFVPPEQTEQNDAGCNAIISISVILLVSCSAVSLINTKTKKRR